MEENRLYEFLSKFENREGMDEENKLFDLLEYAIIDENYLLPRRYRETDSLNRFKKVKEVLENTDDEIIESNIYLKSCKDFLKESKENCTDIIVTYQLEGKDVEQIIYNESIPRPITEPELLHLPHVYIYNETAKELKRMYEEINRLQLWNIVKQSKLNKIDIQNVSVDLIDKETAIINTTFNEKKNINNKPKTLKK